MKAILKTPLHILMRRAKRGSGNIPCEDLVQIIQKPWGREEIISCEGRAIFKRLCIKSGEALSLQYHRGKDEFMVVVKGRIRLERHSFNDRYLEKNESVFIPAGIIHRIYGCKDSEVLELSCGLNSDVVRLDDQYGRIKRNA